MWSYLKGGEERGRREGKGRGGREGGEGEGEYMYTAHDTLSCIRYCRSIRY